MITEWLTFQVKAVTAYLRRGEVFDQNVIRLALFQFNPELPWPVGLAPAYRL